jgi:hypothetical protein
MIGIRIGAAAVFLFSLTLPVSAAETASSEDKAADTAWQHHLWSQKLVPNVDPETTGSIRSQPFLSTDKSRPECVPAGLMFSNPPMPEWRIGSCS